MYLETVRGYAQCIKKGKGETKPVEDFHVANCLKKDHIQYVAYLKTIRKQALHDATCHKVKSNAPSETRKVLCESFNHIDDMYLEAVKDSVLCSVPVGI